MIKFIAKVLIAGELNDLRREAKKRNIKRKEAKEIEKILLYKLMNKAEEELEKDNNRDLKVRYESNINKKIIEVIVLIASIILSCFHPIFFMFTLTSVIRIIACVIEELKIRFEVLERE